MHERGLVMMTDDGEPPQRILRQVARGLATDGEQLFFSNGEVLFIATLEKLQQNRLTGQLRLGEGFGAGRIRSLGSWVAVLGERAVCLVDVSDPEPLPSIPGADYLGEVTEAVWTTDPEDLKKKNTESLQEAGVDDETVEALMNSDFVSPTQQTYTVSILQQLEGVEGRDVIVEIAAPADSLELAQFNLANASLLAAYHRSETPLTAVLSGGPIPVGLTGDGGLIILASADQAFWVEDLAGVIEIMADRFADREATSRELWLRGMASPRFVAEVGDLGWTVRQSIDLQARAKVDLAKLP